MNEGKSKAEGWRKMSVGAISIGALAAKGDTMAFKIAVLICVIACVHMICQSILDYGKRPPKPD